MQPSRASKIAAGPQEADPVTVEATGYGLPCRSSINANTAAITFSSSAILRMIAVEGSPSCRAASSIKACCAPLRRSSNDRTLAEALWEHGRDVESHSCWAGGVGAAPETTWLNVEGRLWWRASASLPELRAGSVSGALVGHPVSASFRCREGQGTRETIPRRQSWPGRSEKP